MHEFSLMADLMHKIEAIAHEQRASRVIGVKVKLGALCHISADHFRDHFLQAANGTVANGARLDIEVLCDVNDPQAQEILLDSLEIED